MTLDFVIVCLFLSGITYLMWYSYVAYNYRQYILAFKTAKGANRSGSGIVSLSCELDKKICISKATEIHTNPNGTPYEDPNVDSISSTDYGAYNPQTTVNKYKDMAKLCNGLSSCDYKFSPSLNLPGTPQLIASYTCVPNQDQCLVSM